MRRGIILAVMMAAATPASAQTGPRSAPPAYSTGDQWPRAGDRFYYAVQTPAGPKRMRFTYVEAVSDGRDGWTVTVACGEHATATGKEITRIVAKGTAGRGRMTAIGGQARFPDGMGLSFLIDQPPRGVALNLRSDFTDARCASGVGQLPPDD